MRFRVTLLLPALSLLLLFACKQKKAPAEKFFPVLSYLKSQAAKMDTTLYAIRKYVFVDSTRTDTAYIHRDQFRETAYDFLSIPDIAESKYADRYKEEKQVDETLNRVILTYTPVNPENEEIQSEQVLIKPDVTGDKVTNIIINLQKNSRDSLVEKRMLWKIDESFQVTTTRQLKQQPETTTTYKVTWNEEGNE